MPEPDPRFEVPPEYAEVYEQAFRRASNTPSPDVGDDKGRSAAADPYRRSWWVRRPAALGPLVLMLVVVAVAAYVVGRTSLGGVGATTSDPGPGRTASTGKASASPSPTTSHIQPVLASTLCAEPRVSDGEGTTLSFAPGNVLDDDTATSWGCNGSATGQQLVLTLPRGSRVTAVGLLPTAAVGGVAINRINAVDWVFDDGTTVHQVLAAPNSQMQVQAVPATTTRTVRLRLASVTSGPADLTAVSSVTLTG